MQRHTKVYFIAIYPSEDDGFGQMAMWRRPSADTLLAAHLRGELERGRWRGKMPGVIRLARELGAARNTVESALRELEREGLLMPQGQGRGRVITPVGGNPRTAGLRIGILPYEASDRGLPYLIDAQHQLAEAGNVPDFTEKTLLDLGRDVNRVAKMVERTKADAWVVVSGSREVLEWFAGREIPVFALFGRRRDLKVAGVGPDKVGAIRDMVRHLVKLGHRRVVLLALAARRLPEPGLPERAFLEELAAHGIPTGHFNLPEWEESPEGLLRLIDSLLKMTPPTALLIDEAYLFHAVKHHLSRKGYRVPEDISLICTDPDRTFDWCLPSIAHVRWSSGPIVRRIVRWAGNVAHGREDRRQTVTPAQFVAGGTVGPAKVTPHLATPLAEWQ